MCVQPFDYTVRCYTVFVCYCRRPEIWVGPEFSAPLDDSPYCFGYFDAHVAKVFTTSVICDFIGEKPCDGTPFNPSYIPCPADAGTLCLPGK